VPYVRRQHVASISFLLRHETRVWVMWKLVACHERMVCVSRSISYWFTNGQTYLNYKPIQQINYFNNQRINNNLRLNHDNNQNKTRKNAIIDYLDYQITVTQLKGPKGNGDMQAAKRDWNAPPTGGKQI